MSSKHSATPSGFAGKLAAFFIDSKLTAIGIVASAIRNRRDAARSAAARSTGA